MKEIIGKIKGYIKSHTWLKYTLIWIGVLVISVLGMNDNYHTSIWINRIIPPFEHEGMTWFTGTIILFIAIYNLFRAFYYTTGNYLFDKSWKCFIATVVFINLISGINESAVQKIRGLQSGLNAIYLDRDKRLGVNLYDISEGKEKNYRIEGYSNLKNCSNQSVGPFKVTVILEEDENHPGGSFTCEKTYELRPEEERTVELNYEGPLNESDKKATSNGDIYLIFEGVKMILWNEDEQVTFYSE